MIGELRAAIRLAQQGPQDPQHLGGADEPPVEEQIGNPSLLLQLVGQSDVFGLDIADIDNDIGMQLGDGLGRGRLAAGQASDHRKLGIGRRQQGGRRRRQSARPTDQLFRRQRIEQEGRRRPGRHHAMDRLRNLDPAPGGIRDLDPRGAGEERDPA
jgi:hypothetical protein